MMVARNRKDRPVVLAKGLVELIVVILPFAEVIDDVSQVEEKRRTVHALRLYLRCHRICNTCFVLNRRSRTLRSNYLGGTSISYRMKGDFFCLTDGISDLGGNV